MKAPVRVYGYGVPIGLAISPDGKSFVTGGPLRAILRDIESGQVRQVFDASWKWQPAGDWFPEPVNAVTVLALSPDGNRLITMNAHEKVQLWDVQSGQKLNTLEFSNWVSSVVVSGDGATVGASWGETVLLWDATSGQVTATLTVHTNGVSSVALSYDGATLLTGSAGDRVARLWNVQRAELLQCFAAGESVQLVAFAPGEKEVVVASQYRDAPGGLWVGHVRWFDAATGGPVRALEGNPTDVRSLTFSPDGSQVVTAHGDQSAARIWEVASGQLVHTLEHPGEVYSAAFTPDGSRVLTQTWGGCPGVWLWEAATGELVHRFGGYASEFTSVAFSPDGSRVATGARMPGEVCLWDSATGELLHSFDQTNGVNSIAFSPDGTQLLAGGRYPSGTTNGDVGIVYLRDVASGQCLQIFSEDLPVNAVTFSPDGKAFLTGCGPADEIEGYARIWTLETGQVVRTFRKEQWAHPVVAVAFSPDGGQVLSGSGYGRPPYALGGTIDLWDIQDDRLLWTQHSNSGDGAFGSVAFFPDGRRVMVRSVDTYFLDRTNGQVLSSLPTEPCGSCYPEIGFGSAALSPSGTQVLTSSAYYFMGQVAAECGQLIDAETGQVVCGLPWGGSPAIFSPDGKYVLTASASGVVMLWDIRDTLARVRVRLGESGPQIMWDSGILQYAPSVTGPWIDLPTASPLRLSTIGHQGYFRVKIE